MSILKKIDWMNVKAVADFFGTSESTVRRMIKRRKLKAYKIGGRDWLIDPADCEKRLEESSNTQN